MTRINRIILSTMLLALTACGDVSNSNSTTDNVVNVYNWADYIGDDTIRNFEAETGIKVNYDTYASAATVTVKLLTGNSGYDVVLHSNAVSSQLIATGIYQKLDMSRLPNRKNLDPATMQRINVYEETDGYWMPYHWGSTGYAWNAEMVRERLGDHPMDSSDVLFDPDIVSKLADCGVSLLDGPTDLFPMVLAYLGLDPNAVDDQSLARAEAQIKLIRPYIRYFSNQKMMSDLPNKEVCVAMSWSGDYAQAAARAEEAGIDIDLHYTTPREGSGLWVDGLYIPSDAPNKDNAYLFLNFMMRPDIAAANASNSRYANANGASWALMAPELLANPAIFPDEKTWAYLYPIKTADPKRERPRTRAFARAKSGI